MACYCCVLGCKSNNHKMKGKHFFRFPNKDEKRRNLWKKFARKTTKATAVICEDHFEPKFMRQKDKNLKLTSDAVPTMFYKKTKEGLEIAVKIGFDGEDYYGDEADEMTQMITEAENKEVIAIETAFMNDQLKLDELRSRCRFCAEIRNELIDISSFETYNINLNDFLQFMGVQDNESDFFPNSVCEDCFSQVLVIDTFKIKFKAAEQFLWDEIGKLKTFTAAVASSLKSSETTQEEHVISMASERCDENEQKLNESINNETYTEAIDEDEINNTEIVEGDQMFTVSYENAEICSNAVTTRNSKQDNTKIPKSAIMDPSCNKFAMKSYNCEVCHKVFAGLKTYKSHICDVLEIRCFDCGDKFETVFALKSHRRHLHNGNQQKNYCSICQTIITGRPSVFKKHKMKCNRNRVGKIKCESCPKTFASLHGYTVHQMFHESKKKSEKAAFEFDCLKPEKKKPNVICELCGRTYTTIGDCRRHIKLKHTEITEVFSCDICNKNYPSKSVLKDHFRNTHVVNEVACTFCGKVFRNKTHLKKHMVYHDESKKVHKCSICPDQPGFINKVGLLRHQSRHANNECKVYYNCDICVNYNFHTNLQLKSHLKHVHGIDQ